MPVFLFIMNISPSSLRKRTVEMQTLSDSGVSIYGMFFVLIFEVLVVSVLAGIIGGFIAMSFSGMAVNLQLATIILKIGHFALVKGLIVAIILGFLGNILPILKLCFSPHRIHSA